jgi:hypothetical protein
MRAVAVLAGALLVAPACGDDASSDSNGNRLGDNGTGGNGTGTDAGPVDADGLDVDPGLAAEAAEAYCATIDRCSPVPLPNCVANLEASFSAALLCPTLSGATLDALRACLVGLPTVDCAAFQSEAEPAACFELDSLAVADGCVDDPGPECTASANRDGSTCTYTRTCDDGSSLTVSCEDGAQTSRCTCSTGSIDVDTTVEPPVCGNPGWEELITGVCE